VCAVLACVRVLGIGVRLCYYIGCTFFECVHFGEKRRRLRRRDLLNYYRNTGGTAHSRAGFLCPSPSLAPLLTTVTVHFVARRAPHDLDGRFRFGKPSTRSPCSWLLCAFVTRSPYYYYYTIFYCVYNILYARVSESTRFLDTNIMDDACSRKNVFAIPFGRNEIHLLRFRPSPRHVHYAKCYAPPSHNILYYACVCIQRVASKTLLHAPSRPHAVYIQ